MIIQLQSTTAENIEAARESLQALAQSWGQELEEAPARQLDGAGPIRNDDKVIDPVSIVALVVAIPSAVLAVFDLADRIQKRRRAKELIDHAQQLADENVTIFVLSQGDPVELTTLDPDQLLNLESNPTE